MRGSFGLEIPEIHSEPAHLVDSFVRIEYNKEMYVMTIKVNPGCTDFRRFPL